MKRKVIVVGTGAGGATAASRLQGPCDVTIIEEGKSFRPFAAPINQLAKLRRTGLFLDEKMIQLLFPNMKIRKSGDIVMVNGIGIGGTTTLATGNAVRTDAYMKEIGIDLDQEFEELYKMLPITVEHQKYWNKATSELFHIFNEMGLDPVPTPKFLNTPQCANCGHCAIGCPSGIKWDTRALIQDAVSKGARLITGKKVESLLYDGNSVVGVKIKNPVKQEIYTADIIVLAAGGFGTPVILNNSGIKCDSTLFVDPVLCVAAYKEGFRQSDQLLMPFYSQQNGYMLSPYMDYLSFFFNKDWRYPMDSIVSLMIKMSDDSKGFVDGKKIIKDLSGDDVLRLEKGVEQCKEILGKIGIREQDMFLGTINAGHPGGMLPLTHETKDSFHDSRLPENVYVADASLFPRSAGLPPILTIMALAMRISNIILR